MTTLQTDRILTTYKGKIMDGIRELRTCKRLAKISVLLLLWLVSIDTPQSHGSGVWTNEPAGASVVMDCPFNSVQGCGILDAYSSSQIASDSSAPISANSAVKSIIYAGSAAGGMQLNYATSQPYREMYVGFMWRTNPQFEGRIVQNKLFFVRGPGANGYFGMFNPPGSPTMVIGWGHNSGNLDNSHVCGFELGLWCSANVGPSVVTLGQWTKVEVYFKSSTTMTSRDGTVRWWINGVPAGNYTNINYSPSGLNEWVWSETWDGYVNPTPKVNWEHWIDHLHISTLNGGNSTDSPAGPPSAPTLRGVTVP